MIGYLKRFGHGVAKRNLHKTWMRIYVHAHEAVRTFVHACAWIVILILATGHVVTTLANAGMKFSHILNANILDKLAKIETLSFSELFEIASVMSLPFVLYSAYHALENWHRWVQHGHHCDRHLEPSTSS